MRSLFRINVAAALLDFGLYVLFTAVHHRALDLGASPVEQALIPVIAGIPYVAVTAFGGSVADRLPRGTVVRVAAVGFGVASLALAATGSLLGLYAALPLLGVSTGFYWPGLQASIADRSDQRTLGRHLGAYNVWWSIGKGLGFLAGGALDDGVGFAGALVVAAVSGFATAWLVPPDETGGHAARASVEDDEKATRAARREWRKIGRFAAFGAWGVGATLIALYPDLNRALGRTPTAFGVVLLTVYASQAVAFVGFRRWSGWHYRAPLFVVVQLLAGAALATLPFLHAFPATLAAGAAVGVGLGMCYAASLYYSLHTDTGRGRSTGFNEAVLGSANFAVPLLGGALARTTESIEAPYPLAAAVVVVGVVAQLVLVGRIRRGASRRDLVS